MATNILAECSTILIFEELKCKKILGETKEWKVVLASPNSQSNITWCHW